MIPAPFGQGVSIRVLVGKAIGTSPQEHARIQCLERRCAVLAAAADEAVLVALRNRHESEDYNTIARVLRAGTAHAEKIAKGCA